MNLKPGLYLQIIKNVSDFRSAAIIDKKNLLSINETIPVNELPKISVSHEFDEPIQKLFSFLSDFISTGFGRVSNKLFNILTEASSILGDALGIKLMGAGAYAQAWRAIKPIDLSVNLKFFLGMKDLWDAEKEVYTPIKNIFNSTLPVIAANFNNFFTPSQPAAVNVYAEYAIEYIKFFFSPKKEGAIGTAQAEKKEKQQSNISLLQASEELKKFSPSSTSGTYMFRYFYIINNQPFDILWLNPTVIRNCSFSFSSLSDSEGYPVEGTLDLNVRMQNIFIYGNTQYSLFRK